MLKCKEDSTIIKDFKAYVAVSGLKTVKAWENKLGLFANVQGFTSKTNPHFTKVLQGGTIVFLSWMDIRKN